MTGDNPFIIEADNQNFEEAVLKRSHELPVVIDFWATWCQPCQQLMPLLDKMAEEFSGRFVLAKVNVDQSPEIAGAFGVQSIPHVFALVDGQPVNHFQGLLPEDQLRDWIGTLLPSKAQELIATGNAIEAENPAGAEAKYREAIEYEPKNEALKIPLARTLLAQHRHSECGEIISELESRGFLEPEAEKIKSQLQVLENAEEAGGVDQARQAVQAEPENLSLKLTLADTLAANQKFEEALEICLDVIREDKANYGEEAKQTMIKILDMLGTGNAMASDYRKKLATLLY